MAIANSDSGNKTHTHQGSEMQLNIKMLALSVARGKGHKYINTSLLCQFYQAQDNFLLGSQWILVAREKREDSAFNCLLSIKVYLFF